MGVKTPTDTTKYYTNPFGTAIDDEEIYDVGHVAGSAGNGPDCTVSGNHAYVTGNRLNAGTAPDLRVVGRTMYLKPTGGTEDYGLTFVENAPAVVIQKEDNSTKKTEYSSVAAAIGALADPNTTTSAKEFAGRIVAVLNDQGVAKWVVFISDTNVNSSGVDNTNGNDTIVVDPNANTVRVTTVGDPDGIGSITSRIRKEMERLGYSEIVIKVNSDNEITEITGKRNGVTYTMKQLGDIRVLTPAEEVAEAKDKVTALPKNIDLDADDMIAGGEASAKAAARNAIKAAVEASRAVDPDPADTVETSNGFTLTFTWGAYTEPTTSGAGSIVITSVAIAKNGATETISNITFDIAKLTAEEQAEIEAAAEKTANQTAVNTSKTEIEKLTLTAIENSTLNGADDDAKKEQIVNAVKTTIEAKYEEGVSGTITVSTYTAAVDGVAANDSTTPPTPAVEAKDGSFTVSIALTKGTDAAQATATATLTGTITATPAA